VESTCGECDRCTDCCECSDGKPDVLRNGYFQFHESRTFKANISRRHLSLELEIARIDNDRAYAVKDAALKYGDAIVLDGSLPDTGFEINMNPTNGDLFIEHVTDLCNGLKRASAEVDRCCGMHCHLDAKHYSYFDLFKLCRLYVRIEDGLFDMVSRSRRTGSYSRPCAGQYEFDNYATFKKTLIARLYGKECIEPRKQWDGKKRPHVNYSTPRKRQTISSFNEKYSGTRYSALNLHSFFYRRTIEFRHHQGTVQPDKAANWAMVCAAVLDSASRLTVAQIDALPLDSFDALLAVVPSSLHAYMHSRREVLSVYTNR